MNRYEITIFKPGIVGFDKKGEPYGYTPNIEKFTANSSTEARNIAVMLYEKTGLGCRGHFNVSRETA